MGFCTHLIVAKVFACERLGDRPNSLLPNAGHHHLHRALVLSAVLSIASITSDGHAMFSRLVSLRVTFHVQCAELLKCGIHRGLATHRRAVAPEANLGAASGRSPCACEEPALDSDHVRGRALTSSR